MQEIDGIETRAERDGNLKKSRWLSVLFELKKHSSCARSSHIFCIRKVETRLSGLIVVVGHSDNRKCA